MRLTELRSRPARGRRTAGGAARRGFTLAEMMLALVLFALVAGAMLTIVMRQQRFYRGAVDIVQTRSQMRQAAALLPLDLRGISTNDTLINAAANRWDADIYDRSDTSITFRQVRGSSVLCGKRTAAPYDTVLLAPTGTSGVLSSWIDPPTTGDSIMIFDEGMNPGADDDRWRPYNIKSVTAVKGILGCGFGAGNLLAVADTTSNSYKVVLDVQHSVTIQVNAPVRIFRKAKYSLYQASDNNWYLGYQDCNPSVYTPSSCSAMAPVAGPYRPASNSAGQSGLQFVYYDSTGSVLSGGQARKITRIDVILRGETKGAVDLTGYGGNMTTRKDTVPISIGIRNHF
jgi:prepilin-type N-terminal cleavage/methylation domain-containing protein